MREETVYICQLILCVFAVATKMNVCAYLNSIIPFEGTANMYSTVIVVFLNGQQTCATCLVMVISQAHGWSCRLEQSL